MPPQKFALTLFNTTPESQMLNCLKNYVYWSLYLSTMVPIDHCFCQQLEWECVCVCVCERENFDITSYPEITSISCQDFGYFVPRLDCNFVQDFTLTSYLDSTQYWQFTYTDFFPHYLQPWRTSYTKFNFVTSYQNRYPLL